EGGLRVHEHRRARAAHQNVTTFGLGSETQLVAQAVATATRDGDAQVVAGLVARNKGGHLGAGGGAQAYEVLVALSDALRGRHDGGGHLPQTYVLDRSLIKRRATVTALAKLRGLALPCPARPKAVPWSGLVRTNGRPRVTFTASSKSTALSGARPWS